MAAQNCKPQHARDLWQSSVRTLLFILLVSLPYFSHEVREETKARRGKLSCCGAAGRYNNDRMIQNVICFILQFMARRSETGTLRTGPDVYTVAHLDYRQVCPIFILAPPPYSTTPPFLKTAASILVPPAHRNLWWAFSIPCHTTNSWNKIGATPLEHEHSCSSQQPMAVTQNQPRLARNVEGSTVSLLEAAFKVKDKTSFSISRGWFCWYLTSVRISRCTSPPFSRHVHPQSFLFAYNLLNMLFFYPRWVFDFLHFPNIFKFASALFELSRACHGRPLGSTFGSTAGLGPWDYDTCWKHRKNRPDQPFSNCRSSAAEGCSAGGLVLGPSHGQLLVQKHQRSLAPTLGSLGLEYLWRCSYISLGSPSGPLWHPDFRWQWWSYRHTFVGSGKKMVCEEFHPMSCLYFCDPHHKYLDIRTAGWPWQDDGMLHSSPAESGVWQAIMRLRWQPRHLKWPLHVWKSRTWTYGYFWIQLDCLFLESFWNAV